MRPRVVLTIILSLLLCPLALAESLSVSSPDGQITFTFTDSHEYAQYSVTLNDQQIIRPSRLGFAFAEQPSVFRHLALSEVSRSSHDSTWQQPWGEQRLIRNHYNELVVAFTHKQDKTRTFDVEVKVFNDGLGFRYRFNHNQAVTITREMTEFWIPDSHTATAFWIPGQGFDRQEYLYRETPVKDVLLASTPMTIKMANGTHLAIHEAALTDFAGMSLDWQQLGRFEVNLAPRADGSKVKKSGSFTTPWRTVQIAPDAVGLINSHLTLNLNEPNQLDDVSWVTPGKYIGIWWGMHIQKYTWGSGEQHGATTKNTKRYIDFAAQHGFDGVLVEGWNKGWDGDWIQNSELFSFTESYPDFDLKAVTDYGRKKGVKLVGHHETSGGITHYEKQMDAGFALYQKMGVEQIKTGYVAHGQSLKVTDEKGIDRLEYTDSQPVVNHFLNNIKTAAKYQIAINTHESVKDTGLRRTYPNWISRESARGQEYNSGWAAPNPPNHVPMLAFTRMLSGPMDFTPGIFDLDYPPIKGGTEEHGRTKYMRPQTTIAKQLAEYVVIYSPIQMAADLPENYEARPGPFQFIKDVPTDWEHSVALQGEVGQFVVIARQERAHRHYSGKDWYLGAITNEDSREVTVPLNFLPKGETFEAQVYQDGEQADWQTNPYDIAITRQQVSADDTLTLKLAGAGGAAIRFKHIAQAGSE
ncbi:glycoside hydrolase family 97 protein [Salinimonas lutimaris]|uniref:glycoside hydrolase family 97 protein n=1 Tax=Salinimonas lutimaris TaxID=914153 RepID=UPI0010C10D67|nr:glycoside hydrolase family 97 protein [Salinimonas lutimaris]